MTDHNRQYDLDDELLSAYIDDELSAEERAAVEARLVSDPAAQQLLHELRSVSQSVQAVPTETLGRDLSDSVIAAINAKEAGGESGGVVRGSPDPARGFERRSPSAAGKKTFGQTIGEVGRPAPSDSSDDTMPKLRIFGSKRAFVWAATALAAGLLIMIFQSGDGSKKLPPVAATNRGEARNGPVDEIGQQPRREIALSAAPKSEAAKPVAASPPPSDALARNDLKEKLSAPAAAPTRPATDFETSGRLSGSPNDGAAGAPASRPAVNAPIAASSRAAQMRKEDDKAVSQLRDDVSGVRDQPKSSQVPAEEASPALQASSSGRAQGGALGIVDAMRKSETRADSAAQPFVLVRVVAKAEAIESGSFDRVLAANNISFVSEPTAKQPVAIGGGRVLKEIKSESADKANKSAESRSTDAVLVEAPPATIEMCLSDLNKNSSDFLSIAVSEPPNVTDRFNGKAAPAKKAADATRNLSQFSRGVVPQAEKDSFYLYEYYYGFNRSPESVPEGQPRTGRDGGGIGGRTKSVKVSGGEAAPTVAGQAGPGFRGGPNPGGAAASGTDQDTNDGESLHFKERQLPEVRRARRIDSATFDASASTSQSQSLATRAQSEGEALKKPASQRVPAEVAESKADANNDNLKVLFVFTPEVTSASSAPAANPQK